MRLQFRRGFPGYRQVEVVDPFHLELKARPDQPTYMNIFGLSYRGGQHVIARREIHGITGRFGPPLVRKGARGIVRSGPFGILSSRYRVDFIGAGLVWVSESELKPALIGHGEEAFRWHRLARRRIKIGLFVVFGLPVLVELVMFFLGGGSSADLVAALPLLMMKGFSELLRTLGFGATAVALVVFWLIRRR